MVLSVSDNNHSDERSAPKGNDLGAYIDSEVTGAKEDYQNVRSRALSLVTTSGGFVALVSGLLAIAAGVAKSSVPMDARWTVAVSLAAFIVSALFALCINRPQTVLSSDEDELAGYVKSNWNDTGWDQSIATISVTYLKTLRQNNLKTSKWLARSIAFQITGIVFIAVSVLLILINSNS